MFFVLIARGFDKHIALLNMSYTNWISFVGFYLLVGITTAIAQHEVDPIAVQFQKDQAYFQSYEEIHRGKFKTKHVELNYLHWGQPGEKTFIWLPGSFLSAYDFEPFASALVDAGYYVVSIDHYGHGLTQIPTTDLSFNDFSDDLNSLMNHLHIQSAVIGGFSRGAYMATAFYERHPNKVQKLVLEDGGTVAFKSLFDTFSPAKFHEFLDGIEPPIEVKEALFSIYDTKLMAYRHLSEINDGKGDYQYFGIIKPKDDKWIIYHGLDKYMHMENGTSYKTLLHSPKSTSRYARSIVELNPGDILKNLNVPLLIIEATGETDQFLTDKENEKLKSEHPDLITYHKFSCDNHNIHYSCPEIFLQHLLEFLKDGE